MANASFFTVNLGLQDEAIREKNAVTDSDSLNRKTKRFGVGSFFGEFDIPLLNKTSLSFQINSTTDLGLRSALTFGVEVLGKYYFHNYGHIIRAEGVDFSVEGAPATSSYLGFGIFQRFFNSDNLRSKSRGGLKVQIGGHYNIDTKYFINLIGQYLLGGSDYKSIEAFAGLGYRL